MVEEEIIEDKEEPVSKSQKSEETVTSKKTEESQASSSSSKEPVKTQFITKPKSVGGFSSKKILSGLVKIKKAESVVTNETQKAPEDKPKNGLSLIGAYSDSDSSD